MADSRATPTAAKRRAMSQQPIRDTAPERLLRSELHGRGLRFRLQQSVPGNGRLRIDIAFPAAQVAVFCDGCFWHGCAEHGTWPKTNAGWWRSKIRSNQRRDRKVTRLLKQQGWQVIRVWEHEDPRRAAAKIARAVRRRQPD